MIKEFRDFIIKGNALELAIGIIIGAAFGAVISSLVGDLIMPIIAAIFQAPDFSNIFIVLRDGAAAPGPYPTLQAAKDAGAAAIGIGTFINTVINLLIVGFALFMVVKAVNRLNPPPAPPPAGPTTDEKILAVLEKLDKKL
jgi:large conductance mechanosensitive channel